MSGEKCEPVPVQVPTVKSLWGLWPPSLLSPGVLAGHGGVSGEGWSPRKDGRRGQQAWVCENPWADKDAAMLGTAESCSSGALPQGAGAGATLGVVTEALGRAGLGGLGWGAWVLRGQGLNSEMLSPSASRPPPGLGLV